MCLLSHAVTWYVNLVLVMWSGFDVVGLMLLVWSPFAESLFLYAVLSISRLYCILDVFMLSVV